MPEQATLKTDQPDTTITVELAKLLTPDELASFKKKAEEAGHSLEEHFLAITLGPKPQAA